MSWLAWKGGLGCVVCNAAGFQFLEGARKGGLADFRGGESAMKASSLQRHAPLPTHKRAVAMLRGQACSKTFSVPTGGFQERLAGSTVRRMHVIEG